MKRIPEDWTWAAHSPAADTAAVVTLPAVTGGYNLVACVIWGYDGAPVGGGSLIITDGTSTITVPIATPGPGKLELARPFAAVITTAITVTLAAGGTGVTGNLNVQYG